MPRAPTFEPAGGQRLARLRTAPRRPGEASFFYWDGHFRGHAVKVLPGEYFVADDDLLITTTLGSCIAACLWDRQARVGGMNHFMLPDGGGADDDAGAGRYGGAAMSRLIDALLERGASRATLEAKVFGGGAVVGGMTRLNVGERNTRFAIDYLQQERIPIVGSDVLAIHARKVCVYPASGKVMVRRLAPSHRGEAAASDLPGHA